MHLSKGFHEEYAESMGFAKYKFCHRSFDNSLQKISNKHSLERYRTDTFDSYFNGQRNNPRLSFKSCVVSTCTGTFYTQFDIPDETLANIYELKLLFHSKTSMVDIYRAR